MNKMQKKLITLFTIATFLVPNLVYAKDIDKYSKSSILIDQKTNRIIYEKEADTKRPLASLSKMMTFLIALECIEKGQVKKEDIIEIDSEIASIKGSTYKLKEGEKIPLIELMKGLMIVSGNDAAVAIAKHIAGSKENFVNMMNTKSLEIGMTSTNFVNPHGLPIYDIKNPENPPKENISTARDIAILGKYLLDNYEDEVTNITDLSHYEYSQRGFSKNNTNPLLNIIDEVDGIKTGYTGNAGYCLSFSMKVNKDEKNDIDNRLIGVVLGANHKNKRLESSLSLLNYGKNNFKTVEVIQNDELIAKKYISGIEDLEVVLKTKEPLYSMISNEEQINSQITIKELNYPIKKGDVVGVIKYYTQTGETLGNVEIISDTEITDVSFKDKIKMLFNK